MSWRAALRNEEPIIIAVIIDTTIVTDSNLGIKVTEHRMTKTAAQTGRPFGRNPLGGIGGQITDTLNYRRIFPPYLTAAPDHEVNMEGSSSFGTIGISNTDGLFKSFQIGEALGGKRVLVYLGASEDPIGLFEKVIETQIESVSFTNQLEDFTVTIKDLGPLLLNTPCQKNTYSGQGGIGGDENIEGDLKPLIVGQHNPTGFGGGVRQPKLIDSNRLIYQVNDGRSSEAIHVMDSGVGLTRNTEFNPATHSIFNFFPGQGSYAYDPVRGLIRLGSTPVGVVTCNQSVRTNFGGWINPVGVRGLVRSILIHTGIGVGILNDTSLARLGNDTNVYRVGYEIMTDITDKNVLEVIESLCEWSFSFWFFDSLGKLNFYEIIDPSWTTTIPTVLLLQEDVISVDSIETVEGSPTWKWVVNTVPNFYTHGESELAGSIKDTPHGNYLVRSHRFRAEAKDEHRRDSNEMSSSKEIDSHIMVNIIPDNSPFDKNHAPAQRRLEVTKQRKMHRIVYTLSAKHLFNLTPGMILENHYTNDLFELEAGERLQISSVRNDLNNRHVVVEALW